jgi:hypothetical protein
VGEQANYLDPYLDCTLLPCYRPIATCRFRGRAISQEDSDQPGREDIVRHYVAVAIAAVVCVGAASRVEAYPLLQLDIVGGTYDRETATIVSDGDTFMLLARLTPEPNTDPAASLAETYYISAVVSPQVGPIGSTIGSFTYDGDTYRDTGDIAGGTPRRYDRPGEPFVPGNTPADTRRAHGIPEPGTLLLLSLGLALGAGALARRS